ncbi:MAG: hypothetical protein KAQ89_01895 [Planctomycetes bacterium]|nr:hypothetical protein [Planctomycetota bacterium]
MLRNSGKLAIIFLLNIVISIDSFCMAAPLDREKYISTDEVRPGMEAYCLTCYKGTEIEKFPLEVLSVVRDVSLGRDAILVQGTDERFIHTGPVAGCSGSPVYIDGRLAGALAFGWNFSKDPLYGVTPIADMLQVGERAENQKNKIQNYKTGYAFDYSVPIDFNDIYLSMIQFGNGSRKSNSLSSLPCPLVTSGLPTGASQNINSLTESFGFMPVSGISGGNSKQKPANVKLVPGACLAVSLVTGDITVDAIGTVTEVVGDKVYGFGHSFLGYGAIDLPMATGQVHTVVSSLARSFKLASAVEIVGALRSDESTAVYGKIGARAKMIPLTIEVDRFNDTKKRVYNCQLANNQLFTPLILSYVIRGLSATVGTLPPEHTIEYKMTINIEGDKSIVNENISTSVELWELIEESAGSVAILLNNPYSKTDIKSIAISIRQLPENSAARIWSVDLSDSKVKAGQNIDVSVIVESFLKKKKGYKIDFKIPEDLPNGTYDLILCGGYDWREFLLNTAPYKFTPENFTSLIDVINSILAIRRDSLYCVLILPPDGVAIERAELPDLPSTKTLIFQNARRTLNFEPYPHWQQKSLDIDAVIIDEKIMQIEVCD